MTLDTRELSELCDDETVSADLRTYAAGALALTQMHGEHAFRAELTTPGHITASAVVLSPDHESVLVIHHKKLLRWLQPGGHVERADLSLLGAAMREASEETAVSLSASGAFLAWVSIDVIPKWKDVPGHVHYDLKYAMVAEKWAIRRSSEVAAVAWADVTNLAALGATPDLAGAVSRALHRFGRSP